MLIGALSIRWLDPFQITVIIRFGFTAKTQLFIKTWAWTGLNKMAVRPVPGGFLEGFIYDCRGTILAGSAQEQPKLHE